MAYINDDSAELYLKILYVGANNVGKTTNLQSLYKQTSGDIATRFFDLHNLQQRNIFFDFLPLSFGDIKAHALRLHIYTLPSHDLWNTVNFSLCTGVDGIVFTIDSRISRLWQNELQLNRIKKLLQRTGKSFNDIPLTIQYNHRDAIDVADLRALKAEFSRYNAADIEAVAVQDIGVMESLDAVVDRILLSMEYSDIKAENSFLRKNALN